jgi:rhodanese-related sulfurtransferase
MAAREVMKLGYTDVRQMPDGIEGWKLSGRKVERP